MPIRVPRTMRSPRRNSYSISGAVITCVTSPPLRRCTVRVCDLTIWARVEGQFAAWRNCVVFHRMTTAIRIGIAIIISAMTISTGSNSGANAIARPPAAAHQNCWGRPSVPLWPARKPSAISARPSSPATAAPMRSASPRNPVLLSATGIVRRRISAESVPSPSREKAACIASVISVACAIASVLDGARTLRRVRLGLADRVEHDDRDLALGLGLVIGVRRPEFERLLPEFRALRAGGGAGPRLHLRGADLHLDLGVGEEVAVPARMLRRAALRGDDDVAAIAGVAVEQRKDELLAGFPPGRRQQQRWDGDLRPARLGHLVEVPLLAAAGEIAVGVLQHPIRQVRRQLCVGHGSISFSSA